MFASLVRRRRRRRPVTPGVFFLVQHRIELPRLVRVDRQQLVDHLSDGRVFSDPRIRVHVGRTIRKRVSIYLYYIIKNRRKTSKQTVA